ncbi:multidrug efflux MFS transporter [Dickeya lacustris]|uniref:Multidrug efflux MFS transporter n=1 Tax=Dickeya lacustris TaxID=2259638 RepID=A0ABY8GAP1_9GAMM|nr:multidrug efflux MFS transporter [Dickeya lacustris]WFN57047.1 multidrug efflux MFS transporter [Dickeya lacustris]
METWKLNLFSAWLGCFFTGMAMSQILPFLPLYIEHLGVSDHTALNLWSGLVFSCSFLVSAVVAPLWGSLADRKGRKLMLLRAALGMSVIMGLQGMATNVWQLFILRTLMGLTSGYIPNAMALIASQVPRNRSGWALGTLSTGQVAGVLIGPLLGGMMADTIGLRTVFFVTSGMLFICFLITLFAIRENAITVSKKEQLSRQAVFSSLPYPLLIISLCITTLMIQMANGSISPILTLFIRDLSPNIDNIAFVSGVIAAVPGVSALLSAPRLGKLGDRIGSQRVLVVALFFCALLFFLMSAVQSAVQLGILRFALGFADGALMPAVQALLVRYSSQHVTGRLFGYNQSCMYLGNVAGPLLGSGVSALYGYRWVFLATALLILINAIQLAVSFARLPKTR